MTRKEALIKAKTHWLFLETHPEWNGDKEIVLVAVKQVGWVLQCASNELKNDKEVALIAIQKNDMAFKYVSNELKNDKEIVLSAIQQNGKVLQYVSDELKNNKEIVLSAMNSYDNAYKSALDYASEEIKKDLDILYFYFSKNTCPINNKNVILEIANRKELEYFHRIPDDFFEDLFFVKELIERSDNTLPILLKLNTNELSQDIIIEEIQKDHNILFQLPVPFLVQSNKIIQHIQDNIKEYLDKDVIKLFVNHLQIQLDNQILNNCLNFLNKEIKTKILLSPKFELSMENLVYFQNNKNIDIQIKEIISNRRDEWLAKIEEQRLHQIFTKTKQKEMGRNN